jgi:hypothetical protein
VHSYWRDAEVDRARPLISCFDFTVCIPYSLRVTSCDTVDHGVEQRKLDGHEVHELGSASR